MTPPGGLVDRIEGVRATIEEELEALLWAFDELRAQARASTGTERAQRHGEAAYVSLRRSVRDLGELAADLEIGPGVEEAPRHDAE